MTAALTTVGHDTDHAWHEYLWLMAMYVTDDQHGVGGSLRQHHPLEVCLLSSHSQLTKCAIEHPPDIFREVCVWCDVTPPQVIQKLHQHMSL